MQEKARLAASRIGHNRLRLLETTGFLALKLPAKEQTDYDTF